MGLANDELSADDQGVDEPALVVQVRPGQQVVGKLSRLAPVGMSSELLSVPGG